MERSRYTVEIEDFVGRKHPYITMSEEVAKGKVYEHLKYWIMHNLMSQVNMWAYIGPRQQGEHAGFVKEGEALFWKLDQDLSEGKVWKAYHRLKDFEEEFHQEFPELGLVGAIGSVRVLPDPEPEE